MLSVGGMSQLERMGSELKCPICLSLYKNAATISCNHTFCRSCILESMRTTACCPVCKTHSSRREVRPAPQMDSLVEIYRGMETSAGVCLFPTQTCTQAGGKGLADDKSLAKSVRGRPVRQSMKKKATNMSLDPRKRRRRGKSDQSESDADSDVEVSLGMKFESSVANVSGPNPQGFVLAKKRVQGPQSPHMYIDLNLETGVEPERSGMDEVLKDEFPSEYQPSTSVCADPTWDGAAEISSRPCLPLDFLSPAAEGVSPNHQEEISRKLVEMLNCNDNGVHDKPVDLNLDLELQGFPSLRQAFSELPQLTPFFWVPNHVSPTQDEPTTQTQLSAQPVRPAFSDLKDSDDEGSLDDIHLPDTADKLGVGEAEGYESDIFEWTQTPCSPELSCSPTRYEQQACSRRPSVNSHVREKAFKHGEDEPTRGLPTAPEASIVHAALNSEVHHRNLRQTTERATNKCTKLSSEHDEVMHCLDLRRSSRTKTRHEGAAPAIPGPVGLKPPFSQLGRASNTVTDERITKPQGCLSEGTKDSVAAANRFLDLLRDGPPEFACEPLTGEVGPRTPKDQPVDSSGGKALVASRKPKTASEIKPSACRFCGTAGNSEIAGEMMRYQMGTLCNRHVHVHKLCAEWAPNVYFEEDDGPRNLTSEISRGNRIKCIICGKRGAALGCCNNKCKNSYHYPCARLLKGCQWNEDDYVMFCPQHARGRFLQPRRRSRDGSNSTIETESTEIPSVSADRTDPRLLQMDMMRYDPRGFKASAENRAVKWAPGPAHKWVLCGSGLDSQLKAQVASFASVTGATLLKTWSSVVTHVITGTDKQGAAKRTLKYLLALLEGKWIVTTNWMNECILQKQPVAEESHLVTSDVNGFFGGPCLSRHLVVSKAPKLFEGLSLYLCGDYTPVLKADMHSLVAAGGGTVLHRKPLPLQVSSNCEPSSALQEAPRPGQIIALYNGEADSGRGRTLAHRIQEAMSVSIPAGAHALPCSWLLDSIAQCRLLPPN